MNRVSRRHVLEMIPAAMAAPMAAQSLMRNAQEAKPRPVGLTRLAGEDRGIWIHPERTLIMSDEASGRAAVKQMLARYTDAGFNLILPWIVSGYFAAVEHPELRSAHPSAAWDALGVIVEEASALNLNVDLWYAYTEYRNSKSPEFTPAYGGDPAWRAISADKFHHGKDEAEGAWNVCPMHEPARQWQMGLLDRALKRYPNLRGVQIEEPGYDTRDYCLCALCRSLFEQVNRKKLEEHLQSQQAENLKTIGNSAFIWELREYLRTQHPQMLFTINGGHDWRRDRRRGRDWGRWALAGWMDAFIPQVYEENVEAFRRNLRLTVDDIGRGCAVQAGIALAWSEGKNDIDMVIRQIDVAREIGAKGLLLFHGAAFTDSDLKKLADGPFRG